MSESVSSRLLRRLWRHFEDHETAPLGETLCDLARNDTASPLDLFGDHPLGDEWRDFAVRSVSEHLIRRQGIVYVAANPAQQGFYKVGATKDFEARLRSLSGAGVVGEFLPVHERHAVDRFAAERLAHQALERIAPRHKEFFVVDPVTAINTVNACIREDRLRLRQAFPGCLDRLSSIGAASTIPA